MIMLLPSRSWCWCSFFDPTACWASNFMVSSSGYSMTTDTSKHVLSTTEVPRPRESRNWLWSLLVGLAILGGLALIPLLGDASTLHIWTLIVMYAVMAQSWNFIGGFTGYSAFGNVAFFGIGAYTTGLILLRSE